MLANHYRGLFAACLAATLACQACQTTQETEPEAAAGARPVDSRTALKEARYREAVQGLDFDSGLVIVVEATGDDPALAREYRDQGLERLESKQGAADTREKADDEVITPESEAATSSSGRQRRPSDPVGHERRMSRVMADSRHAA